MKGDLQCRCRFLQLQIVVAVIILLPLVHGQPDHTVLCSDALFVYPNIEEDTKGLMQDYNACETATLESEPSRYFNESSVTNRCDSGLATGWYKFELNRLPAEITTRCIKNNHCGTQLPLHIELDGNDLPDVNQTLKAYVCGSYNILGSWDCCVLRKTVYIRNCTTFYAYYLQPTDRCPVAYCLQVKGEYPLSNMTVKTGEAVHGGNQGPVGNAGSVQQQITPQASSTATTGTVNTTTSTITLPTHSTVSALSTTSDASSLSTTVSNASTVSASSPMESSTSSVTTSVSNASTAAIVSIPAAGNTSRSSNSSVGTTPVSSVSQTTTPVANVSSNSSSTRNTTTQSTVTNSSTISTTTSANQPSTQSTSVITTITQSSGGVTESVTESNVSVASTNQSGSFVSTTSASSDVSTPSRAGYVSSTTPVSPTSPTANAVTVNTTGACSPNISESFRCGNSSCFRLPNGQVHVYCMLENGGMACVVACNSYPDCADGADEMPDLCVTDACSEGQRHCPNKTGCYNDCIDRDRRPLSVWFDLNVTGYDNFQATNMQSTFNEDVRRAISESLGTPIARAWFENSFVRLNTNRSQPHIIRVYVGLSYSGHEQIFQRQHFSEIVAARLFGNTSDGQVPTTVSPTNSSSSLPITNTTEPSPQSATTTAVASPSTYRPAITHASNTTNSSTRSTNLSQSISTSPPISSNTSITSPVTNAIATSDQPGQTTAVSSTVASSSASIVPLDTSTVTSERTTTGFSPHNVSNSTSSMLLTTPTASGTSSSDQNVSSSTPDNTPRTETLPETTFTTAASSTHVSSSTLTHVVNQTQTQDNSLTSSIISTVRTTASTTASSLSSSTISVSSSDAASQSETVPTSTTVRSNEATTDNSIRTTGESISSSSTSTSTLVTAGLSSPTTRESSSTVDGRPSTLSSQFETTPDESTRFANLPSIPTTLSTLISSQTPSTRSTSGSLTSSTASLLLTESTSSIQTKTNTPSLTNVSSTEAVGQTATIAKDTSVLDNHTSDNLNTVETPTDVVNDDDNEIVKLFKQNTGLFIFIIIAGTAMLAICIFGIGGTIYQKRMRTWQPELDDTYPDMEKSIMSIGRERSGIESPIADIDILQGEETGEGESISKASTLVCGPTPDRLQGTNPGSYDTPVTGTSTGNSPLFGSLNGHANEAYQSEESIDSDGVTPYEELDERPPRNKFPWIENAEDTKV